MYTVLFTKKSEQDLDFLPQEIRARVFAVLGRIRIRPHRYLKKLTKLDVYRLRFGDYRIIVALDEKRKTIFVLKIGHRKIVYKL